MIAVFWTLLSYKNFINSGYKSLIRHNPLLICLFTTTIWKRAGARSMGRKKDFSLAGMARDTWDGAGGRWHLSLTRLFSSPDWNVPSGLCGTPHHPGVPALQIQHWGVHHGLSHRPTQGLAGGDPDRWGRPALQHPRQSVWGDELVRETHPDSLACLAAGQSVRHLLSSGCGLLVS